MPVIRGCLSKEAAIRNSFNGHVAPSMWAFLRLTDKSNLRCSDDDVKNSKPRRKNVMFHKCTARKQTPQSVSSNRLSVSRDCGFSAKGYPESGRLKRPG